MARYVSARIAMNWIAEKAGQLADQVMVILCTKLKKV